MPRSASCPICGKPASVLHKPFCSRGCVDRDLLQWLGEGYRLPAGPAVEEAGELESPRDQLRLDSADNDD